jgi:hypothetical protein
MRETLELLIDDFHERALPELVPRDQTLPALPRKANAVIGMRRSGKTWFCYQRMQELISKGVEKERLLYLNFEDDRLLPFTPGDFQLILETYYRKFPAFKNAPCYLFLDEVQRIEGWDAFVRRVLDTETMAVCITGSSAKFLSKEIATALRGRSLTTEIFPFSYAEFLTSQGVDLSSGKRPGSKAKAVLQNLVGKYVEIGGFPEVQSLDEELRRQVLRTYLDVVILRDVVERYAVNNVGALRALIRHVLAAPATRFSVNKFYNAVKSQGLTCTKNNLYDFLEYFSDAFLFYQVPIHSRSERVKRVNPSKVYVIDSAFFGIISPGRTVDQGALLENLVYMHLRRRGLEPEYYITDKGAEVDFLYTDPEEGRPRLIQACWDIRDPDTREREILALLAAMKELKVKQGTLVTWMDEDFSVKNIEITPAWKWLLSE